MRTEQVLSLLLAGGLVLAGCGGTGDNKEKASKEAMQNGMEKKEAAKAEDKTAVSKAAAFRMDMRRLWDDHITWTRLYIVSMAADLKDKDKTAARLLKNQEDIGKAIAAFYGAEAGDQLTALLKEHIMGAVTLLDAAKKGDKKALDEATKAWYVNGDQIAAFLNQANPDHWPLASMKEAMKGHLDTTIDEAVAHLHGEYEKDIAAYDKVKDHIYMMADVLSEGIIAQFPEKF